MDVIQIEYKKYMKQYAAKSLADYPLMRQFHKEMDGKSWPYFDESEYDNLLSIVSRHGYWLELNSKIEKK